MAKLVPGSDGRIGPNAVLQISAALLAEDGEAVRARIFQQGGLPHLLANPPDAMVREAEVAALYAALVAVLGATTAQHRAHSAGRATAAYLLAHRIPPWLRAALPLLPGRMAAGLLRRAIQRHGWTFLGSGALRITGGRPLHVRITLARPLAPVTAVASAFYRACFGALFGRLVSPAIRAEPRPAPYGACAFDLAW